MPLALFAKACQPDLLSWVSLEDVRILVLSPFRAPPFSPIHPRHQTLNFCRPPQLSYLSRLLLLHDFFCIFTPIQKSLLPANLVPIQLFYNSLIQQYTRKDVDRSEPQAPHHPWMHDLWVCSVAGSCAAKRTNTSVVQTHPRALESQASTTTTSLLTTYSRKATMRLTLPAHTLVESKKPSPRRPTGRTVA